MPIVDLDAFLEEKERVEFKVNGKNYVIDEMTMDTVLELARLRAQLVDVIDKDDFDSMVSIQLDSIRKAVPEMEEGALKKLKMPQIRKIQGLINKVFLDEGDDREEDKELLFYREKYGDEYRKKESRAEEKPAP